MRRNNPNPQRLQLLQRGNRERPTIYRFGKGEVLCFHANGEINICDKQTMVATNDLTSQDVKDMGYSPVKMQLGNIEDIFLDDTTTPASELIINGAGKLMMTFVVVLIVSWIGNAVGCTNFILEQIDKDIAVTTFYPVQNLTK